MHRNPSSETETRCGPYPILAVAERAAVRACASVASGGFEACGGFRIEAQTSGPTIRAATISPCAGIHSYAIATKPANATASDSTSATLRQNLASGVNADTGGVVPRWTHSRMSLCSTSDASAVNRTERLSGGLVVIAPRGYFTGLKRVMILRWPVSAPTADLRLHSPP